MLTSHSTFPEFSLSSLPQKNKPILPRLTGKEILVGATEAGQIKGSSILVTSLTITNTGCPRRSIRMRKIYSTTITSYFLLICSLKNSWTNGVVLLFNKTYWIFFFIGYYCKSTHGATQLTTPARFMRHGP